MAKYVMALDAGTTSNRAILFNDRAEIVSVSQREFTQYFPEPGLVEHDALELFDTMADVAREAIRKAGVKASDIAAIGIANQRETTILWDKETGEPVCHAIVWQDRRTADLCDEMIRAGETNFYQEKTGLIIDPYFSATKLVWMLEKLPGVRERAERGDLLFGTVETWLIWKLTGGKVHVTDCSNASRTMLFNIYTLSWDEEILEKLHIPACILPEVKGCSEIYGECDEAFFGCRIPIAGAAGDQQAALFGQACFEPGDIKNTYGTGGFLLMNTGDRPVKSENGLVTTLAWSIGGHVTYALEGSVFVCGSVIQWLRDELKLISSAAETEAMAEAVADTAGCYLVPAFTGMAAPLWDPYARGTIVGLTRGVNRDHLVRAAIESMAYQSADVLKAMEEDLKLPIRSIKADGGASANNFLMQFQADIMNVKIERPAVVETTAAGAAYLAGLAVGFFENTAAVDENRKIGAVFTPSMTEENRKHLLNMWHRAVKCAAGWAKEEEKENV